MLFPSEAQYKIVETRTFWVPPTPYVVKTGSKRNGTYKETERVSEIPATARPLVSAHGGKGHTRDPEKNIAEKRHIRNCYLARYKNEPPWDRGKIIVSAFGWATPPKGPSYWPGKPHIGVPDMTNVLKQVEDALNPTDNWGGVWHDDSWTLTGWSDKWYCDESQPLPGLLVVLRFTETPLLTRPEKPRKRKANAPTVLSPA